MAKKSQLMKEIEEQPKYGKDAFVREISDRGDFTISDVRLIVDIIISIIEESAQERRHFAIAGFMKLIYGAIPERKTTDPLNGKRVVRPATIRLTARLGKNIKDKVK